MNPKRETRVQNPLFVVFVLWLVFVAVPAYAQMLSGLRIEGPAIAISLTSSPLADCDHNGVPDENDIADGASDDCNENGIPDQCEMDRSMQVRSGNGTIGFPDESITFLVGPNVGGFAAPFTLADFDASRAGPPANVVSPLFNWYYPLSADPQAQWISTEVIGTDNGATALFAIEFTLPYDGTGMVEMDLLYSVDNLLGNDPAPGVFVNGFPISSDSVGGTHTKEFLIAGSDVTSLVLPGLNTLYIYERNIGGPAGLLFGATIRITHDPIRDCNKNGVPDDCEPDFDRDTITDACDPDVDGDGVENAIDVCEESPLGELVNPSGGPKGDITDDCIVGLVDYRLFETCLRLSGPDAHPGLQECLNVFSFDDDNDVDLCDASNMQVAFNGP